MRRTLLRPFRSRLSRPRRWALAVLLALGMPVRAAWPAGEPTWAEPLRAELASVDARIAGDLGVHVRDLGEDWAVSHRGDEVWYLASMVKVPVALAVLRDVQQGRYGLDTLLTLRAGDRVDGAGSTNAHVVGTRLPVRALLEQMIVFSDNTASDMLIELTGLRQVNERATTLGRGGIGPITTLADVRRQVYGELTPAARSLSGEDFVRLRHQSSDEDRLQLLSNLLDTPAEQFRQPSLADAYAAYYASGLNSGRLDAFGDLLAALAEGQALDVPHTALLLSMMRRVRTGDQRLKAGLPRGVRLAHKTGTQRQRICDAGLLTPAGAPPARSLVVVACVRGERTVAGAEQALQAVGAALCRHVPSITRSSDASACPVVRPLAPAAADRAAGLRWR